MFRPALVIAFAAMAVALAFPQQKGAATKPPKADLPYLLEAQKLIPTDATPATRSTTKEDERVTVDGATSSARTPVPEPIFVFSAGQIKATDFELIHFEVASGRRQWTKGKQERPNNDEEPEEILRLTLRPIAEGIVRIEAAEMLNPGEYALIPRGKDTAFCFTVF
ncbi:MAG: hypothetical protein JO051_18315 [Acidobacteriaceae bacterium]|nr:hypothetical protein [Acidobacteriaceae bacterium]